MTSLCDYIVEFSVAGGTYPVLWGGSSEPLNPPSLQAWRYRILFSALCCIVELWTCKPLPLYTCNQLLFQCSTTFHSNVLNTYIRMELSYTLVWLHFMYSARQYTRGHFCKEPGHICCSHVCHCSSYLCIHKHCTDTVGLRLNKQLYSVIKCMLVR